jgi:hypothetical protein
MTTERTGHFNDRLPSNLSQFIPRTLDERLMALRERLNQAWPTFYRNGGWEYSSLWIEDHEVGTMVRFYAGSPITFHPVGAIKHGPFWVLSAEIDGLTRMNGHQMREFLTDNKLNWVIIK